MKKVLVSLALMCSAVAFSQHFGIKAGVNISSNSVSTAALNDIPYYLADAPNPTVDKSSLTGFHAGVFYNMPLGENFNFQPEILYTTYGAKLNINYAGATFSAKWKMNYLALPLMLQYKLIPDLLVEAGPELGLLMSSKVSGSGQSLDTKEDMKKFNAGIGIGAGYYFTENIGLNARYVAGLTNLDDSGVKSKNNVLQIGLAYKF